MKIRRAVNLITIIAVLLVGCSRGTMFNNLFSRKIVNQDEKLDRILDALQSRNVDELEALFSVNAIGNIEDLHKNIEELFQYFHGEVISYKNFCGGPEEYREKDNGHEKVECYWTYDVITNIEKYRIAFYEVTRDTMTPDNVGVWSFYIIIMENDTNSQYAYRGDGKYSPGIHIGVRNSMP